jgi:hypothetical protein
VPRQAGVVCLLLTGATLGTAPARLAAQSLPLIHSINPVAEARSGLYFQPLLPPAPRWRFAAAVDYASLVELNLGLTAADTAYLLDAEVYRVNLSGAHDLGNRTFVLAELSVGGATAGALDGFLNWYHGLFGIVYPERQARGLNRFGYRYEFPSGRTVRFAPRSGYLGDARLGFGVRHGTRGQTVLSVTLPTATGGDGYARGVPSVSLLNTLRIPLAPRLVYEGSLNLGYTPRHGVLSGVERRTFVLVTSGIRWRTVGRLWSFGNLYFHSPYYESGAQAGQLDRCEFTIDFGWIIRSRSGREFRFGMAEDLQPGGPAVDANFRIGYAW